MMSRVDSIMTRCYWLLRTQNQHHTGVCDVEKMTKPHTHPSSIVIADGGTGVRIPQQLPTQIVFLYHFESSRWISRNSKKTIMILPQVHLRKPCYDFYFL